jgi:hypothetical protein
MNKPSKKPAANETAAIESAESSILEFIKSSRWRFAKTMPQWPHEYVLRTWRPDKEAAFEALVVLIRAHGYDAPFMDGATYHCLEFGDWKYWTMGEPPSETTLINRAKIQAHPART